MIPSLVASLRSNLAELENLVGRRLDTNERIATLLQASSRPITRRIGCLRHG